MFPPNSSANWPPVNYFVAAITVCFSCIFFTLLISYLAYEYQRKRKERSGGGLSRCSSFSEECGQCSSSANGSVVIPSPQNGSKVVPATLRLVQGLAKIHTRILDEYQQQQQDNELLLNPAETIADRQDHLSITSADFDRSYSTILEKYRKSDTLRGLSFSFSIDAVSGSGSGVGGGSGFHLRRQPYATGLLIGSTGGDGAVLKIQSGSKERGGCPSLSVSWVFDRSALPFAHPPPPPPSTTAVNNGGGGAAAAAGAWLLFGKIHSSNNGGGKAKYHLKMAVSSKKKKKRRSTFAVFPAAAEDSNPPGSELLLIKGRPQMVALAASYAGMSKTAITFKVYMKTGGNKETGGKVQIASIEPTIDLGLNDEGHHHHHHSVDEHGHSSSSKRATISKKLFSSNNNSSNSSTTFGDQLYSIKYNKSFNMDQELKSTILAVSFLLCLRYYMKELYGIFHRTSFNKG